MEWCTRISTHVGGARRICEYCENGCEQLWDGGLQGAGNILHVYTIIKVGSCGGRLQNGYSELLGEIRTWGLKEVKYKLNVKYQLVHTSELSVLIEVVLVDSSQIG